MKKVIIVTKREFYGEDYYKFLLSEYEKARVYLKNCGPPVDDETKFYIEQAKWSSSFYKRTITD